jgi:alkyl sulfatase BDS1-like metallo-beta-lactamase superfamily hydrolase
MKIDTKSRPLLCSVAAAAQTQARPPAAKPATEVTKQANAAGQRQLNFADKQDFEAAKRGLIGRLDPFTTRNARDHVVWEKK